MSPSRKKIKSTIPALSVSALSIGVKMLKNFRLKNIEAKEFLKKSVVRNPVFYDAYCGVSFQLTMNSVRDIPQKHLQSMLVKRPIVSMPNKNGWEIIGGFGSLFLVNEGVVKNACIMEVCDMSKEELLILTASEFSELLFYQMDIKSGYKNLIDSLRKISKSNNSDEFITSLASERNMSRFAGVSRDAIRYQRKIEDII